MGIRPMEMVLVGMGACTSFDVMSILRKVGSPWSTVSPKIEAKRADEVPSVFTEIHVHFIVTGNGVREAQVKRAIDPRTNIFQHPSCCRTVECVSPATTRFMKHEHGQPR